MCEMDWFFAVLSGMEKFRSGDDPRGLKELSQGQTSVRVPPLDPSPNVSRPGGPMDWVLETNQRNTVSCWMETV